MAAWKRNSAIVLLAGSTAAVGMGGCGPAAPSGPDGNGATPSPTAQVAPASAEPSLVPPTVPLGSKGPAILTFEPPPIKTP